MQVMGIAVDIKNKPILEPGFIPSFKFIDNYLKGATQPFAFALERNDGYISKYDTFIYGTAEKQELDLYYLKIVTYFALYAWCGWKLYLCGDHDLSLRLKETFFLDPLSQTETEFAQWVYNHPFAIEILPYDQCPVNECSLPIGRHMDGCRIGFDAGSSDRKVSAVIDGKLVYSEEVLWTAKFQPDIAYHFNEITMAFKTAASKMPRVDAIGVSTASIIAGEYLLGGSIFKAVPDEIFAELGYNIYQRATKEMGDNIPLTIINDGDASALAGAISLNKNKLLGLAIGTSIGMGYIDGQGNLTGRMSEIANNRVALNDDAGVDESGTQYGVGESYFSQDSIIRNAQALGIALDDSLYPAQKLLIVQDLMEKDDPRVQKIFLNIGCCLAHTLPLCDLFFDIENIYLLGRVVSAKGGELIVSECRRVLAEEYPDFHKRVTIWLPDEKSRRVSQSVAAASLPVLNK